MTRRTATSTTAVVVRQPSLRRWLRRLGLAATGALIGLVCLMLVTPSSLLAGRSDPLDQALTARLRQQGFTGRIGSTLTARLGRPVDGDRADLGRLLWFDTITGLAGDNTCAGCHSPTNGFGDSQGMAIGVQNNGVVGPDRAGPRNQRRSPLVINTALCYSGHTNFTSFSKRTGRVPTRPFVSLGSRYLDARS